MSIRDDISRALTLMRASTHLDDLGLYRTLVAEGIDRQRAARLVEFLPSLYIRLMLRNSGVRFSDKFQRRLPSGDLSRKESFSDEPVWAEGMEFAFNEIERGLSGQEILAVAGRSAEFDAINQLLKKGSKLENIACTPMVLPWPEAGPKLT